MFRNFIRVLGKGASEKVQTIKLWEDLEQADINLFELPDSVDASIPEWITPTAWYRNGGWVEIRKVAYGSIQEQLDMQYHGTWEAHIQAVKARWPKC